MDFIHVIGGIGTILVLAAYFLVSSGRIESASTSFQGLNLIGALLLTFYAIDLAAWASVALNAVWGLIAVVAVFRILQVRRRNREAVASTDTAPEGTVSAEA